MLRKGERVLETHRSPGATEGRPFHRASGELVCKGLVRTGWVGRQVSKNRDSLLRHSMELDAFLKATEASEGF